MIIIYFGFGRVDFRAANSGKVEVDLKNSFLAKYIRRELIVNVSRKHNMV